MFQGDLERHKKPFWEIADDVISQEGECENEMKGTDLKAVSEKLAGLLDWTEGEYLWSQELKINSEVIGLEDLTAEFHCSL